MKDWLKYARGEGGYSFMRGFALKASTTGVSSKHFCSANYSGTLTPSLSITFNTPPIYNVNATYNSYPQPISFQESKKVYRREPISEEVKI